jgi:hypothetical protein
MAVSINEDVRVGNSTFHVQTEFYRSTGKVVCNIFKDGASIKRFEKVVEGEENPELLVKYLHKQVVNRLLSGGEEIKGAGKLKLSEEAINRIVEIVSPYFGVASYLVLEDVLSKAYSVRDFIEKVVEDLDVETKSNLKRELEKVLLDEGKQIPAESKEEFRFTDELRSQMLDILKDYFGVMASLVLEEAEEKCKGKSYEDLVSEIVSSLEEKEREELGKRLMFLRT